MSIPDPKLAKKIIYILGANGTPPEFGVHYFTVGLDLYLKAIEEERFEDLPAPVYVRGFVTEYARYLKINSQRAVEDFMAGYEAYTTKKKK